MIVLGYLMALIVGVFLGLFGGGGSILTVPILVYIMGISPVSATAYSLFVVGVAALFGAQRYILKKQINIKIGVLFAIPSFIGVFASRKWILTSLPEVMHFSEQFSLSKDTFILILFALIMLLASLSMIFSWRPKPSQSSNNYMMIILDGFIVGIVTGLVGAGGGFLIVPALLLLTNIDMKEAIGTSLIIISIKSLFGFLGELSNPIDWDLMLLFTLLSIIGINIGIFISKHLNSQVLKKSFGIFVLLMAIVILINETIVNQLLN
ncbi:MAG: sulfite exporter TauE/SafE family protein [Flavobacteriales bacterium]|nr:sulfite exporter TauE/SafE family protein [Flavobacteriales bacterium]MBL6873509.1 sulfite exporter TauE/SafE family protein [Flavobacteriales bacterium]